MRNADCELVFFFIWKFLFCLLPGGREFSCADFVESTQPMSSFFYKIAMLALVSKIGTMNPAITDGVAPLLAD
jgi:hypothetical protein